MATTQMPTPSSSPSTPPSPPADKPLVKRVLVAEVKCYLCGGNTGSIESERQPMPRSVLFRRAGEQQAFPVLDWRRLRCERCNGPVYLDESDVVVRRVETFDWSDERPRRGRPPKWLVEQRRRDAGQAAA